MNLSAIRNHYTKIFLGPNEQSWARIASAGAEADAVVISCVRSSDAVGFLADAHRLNVALTRARRLLVVVGNAATLTAVGGSLAELVEDVRAHGVCFTSARLQLG